MLFFVRAPLSLCCRSIWTVLRQTIHRCCCACSQCARITRCGDSVCSVVNAAHYA